jgi:DNA-binding MarR family transcriptional regulator
LTPNPSTTRQVRGTSRGRDGLRSLLRGSHLFASTVHEILHLEPRRQPARRSLTASQTNLLRVICLDGKHPVGQVAQLLGISAPAATKTIDKLARLGLVERHRSGGDRRTRLFSVSPAGRERIRRHERRIAARLRAALDGFAPDEIDQLTRLLTRFSMSLLAAEPDGGKPCLRCAAYIEEDCPVGRARGGCPYREFLGKGHSARAAAGGVRASAGNVR